MKSWILLIVLAVGLSAAATFVVPMLTTDSASNAPGFPAPERSDSEGPKGVTEVEGDLAHKFGVMAQDSDGVHTWIFRNTGPGPLELRNLGTDCSCTIAQLGKPGTASEGGGAGLVVKPGGSEPIDVKWNTRKIDGAYRKMARIGTSDPGRPEIALSVEGTVRPAVILVPSDPTINFQSVNNDEPYMQKRALHSGDRPETQVTRVVSSNPGLIGVEARPMTAEEAKSLKIEKGFAIEVTLKKGPHLGAFAEEVVVETDHPLKKEVRIPVLGRVTGPITVSSEKVVLRDVTSSGGGEQDLILWIRDRTSAKFTVEKKPEGMDVSFESIPQPAGSKGSKYRMAVKLNPGAPVGKIVGEIVLKTDHPQATEVRVPVDVLVQGAN